MRKTKVYAYIYTHKKKKEKSNARHNILPLVLGTIKSLIYANPRSASANTTKKERERERERVFWTLKTGKKARAGSAAFGQRRFVQEIYR